MPRFAGPCTMMRLPASSSSEGLDACFVGVPMDMGASHRSGTRHGPRQIRSESGLLRPYNMGTGAAPFESLQVADIGDVPVVTFNLTKTLDVIEHFFDENILSHGCIPLALGGDHTLTLPVLRAVRKHHGPVGLVHVDAHADTNDRMMGETVAHGTPFRRALDEGLIDPNRVYQIGLRGGGYTSEDFDWGRKQGFRVVTAEECWWRSMSPLMEEVREHLGSGPVYVSFDIDSFDPSVAPGTGTVEIGGLNTWQGLEIVRGCRGLSIVGADLVEVSPPFDPFGNTALMGAQILFELLCALPGVKYSR